MIPVFLTSPLETAKAADLESAGQLLATQETKDVAQEVAKDANNLNPFTIWERIQALRPAALSLLYQVAIILLFFFVGRKLIQWFTGLIDRAMEKAGKVDIGVRHFLVSFLRAALYVILILIIAGRLGISGASLAAVIGSAGLALGLALQGALQNFAGGVLLLTMKPFVVGDYISCPLGEGTVKRIGLIYTTIRTLDNKSITIPNGTLSNGVITNMTRHTNRRFDLKVGVSYSADLDKARTIITRIFQERPEILNDQPVQVFVTALGDSSVELTARGWVNIEQYGDFLNMQHELLEAIKKAFDAAGIEIPFPQMDIHMVSGKTEIPEKRAE
jgi:small conductance mechanosensitive channel